ncbi:YopX family protein [Bacillus atrophaeus]|uniref:YopX family protein n=1 Tax=Bacillus atrophaeus TaxID=1452 RepID=UPI002E1F980A|nr:YopX family protein [Bacillus atrophaeus]
MRDIKFRAWDKEEKEMTDFGGLPMYITDIPYAWDKFHFMQYTGLKDSNDRDIYEGDIIRVTYDSTSAREPYYVGEVKFLDDEDYPAFDLRPWIDCEMNALSWLKSESDPTVIRYEVIGDIYRSPELLEASE